MSRLMVGGPVHGQRNDYGIRHGDSVMRYAQMEHLRARGYLAEPTTPLLAMPQVTEVTYNLDRIRFPGGIDLEFFWCPADMHKGTAQQYVVETLLDAFNRELQRRTSVR